MKKLFMLCALLVIAIPPIAMADHIGIYSDCTGTSCTLAQGFTSTVAVVHKFSLGAVMSRFKIVFPAGSNVFAFATSNSYPSEGNVQTGVSVSYGTCLSGSWCVGNVVAILGAGPMCMQAANGFPSITYIDCSFVELPATGGHAMVGSICPGEYGDPSPCDIPVAVESSTWGSVKALYR